ncbi:MAG: helix-turn-helix domain-containing protein, partial [Deltaproteobacteria bacterium]|nr:helix-turn-helix domain-containing protein [Deltaproteobacteria bacterium]
MSVITATKTVLWNPTISDGSARLHACLTFMAGPGGSCYPSNEYLADRLKVSQRTIERRLDELIDAEQITIDDDGTIHITGLVETKMTESRTNLSAIPDKSVGLSSQNSPILEPEPPVTSTTLATPVEDNPFSKRQVLKDLKEKTTDKRPKPAQPEPVPPTSEQPSVCLSYTDGLKTFSDILEWSNHQCLCCSQEAPELHPVKIDTSRKL